MKFLFLILACCFLSGIHAENRKKRSALFKPEHELFGGAGFYSTPAEDEEKGPYNGWDYAMVRFEGDVYYGAKYTSGAYFLGYSYRVKRWLNLCVSASYTAYWRNIRECYTDRYCGKERSRYFGLVPAVRFTWLNKRYIRMYSTLGIGVSLKCSRNDYLSGNQKTCAALTTPEVTLAGLSVGKNWYGFAEGGISHHGMACIGFGYRFNKKNRE